MGGNTIHFALSGRWERVYGIEKDAQVLDCARHNAEIYGVANQIEWIEGDCFEVLKDVVRRDGDGSRAVLFGSPPWGGEFRFVFVLDSCSFRRTGVRERQRESRIYIFMAGWLDT